VVSPVVLGHVHWRVTMMIDQASEDNTSELVRILSLILEHDHALLIILILALAAVIYKALDRCRRK